MAKKLKIDFHTHTSEDPKDFVTYSATELIDRASELGFDALSITNHDTVTFSKNLADYAEKKGILLLPGIEITLHRKHILLINPDKKKLAECQELEDLAKLKSERTLVIAPHPFFHGFKSLQSDIYPHLSLFDALEFSCCYNHLWDMNKKAVGLSKKEGIPLLGSSDCHNIWQFGMTYSQVEAEKNCSSIIEAIKAGNIEVRTTPLSFINMGRVLLNFFVTNRLHILYKI